MIQEKFRFPQRYEVHASQAGAGDRYCTSGSYRFCYSSRGTPGGATPSLLLLHGFSASKDMWLPIVKHLPRGQHVVCVDMPGHEGTTRTGAQDYCIQGQVARNPPVCEEYWFGQKTLPPGGDVDGGERRWSVRCPSPCSPVRRHPDVSG
ncbi:hypothetical protein KUCAC02_031211, partial [Chaenocephalus aceratus]